MYLPITASQIRAARTYLDWSQDYLAEVTGLGKTTVRNLEAGQISRHSAVKVRKAFEAHGLEFTDGDGVKRRAEGVKVLKSQNSCDEFFEDLIDTVREKGGEVLVMARSSTTLMRSCGILAPNDPQQLQILNAAADVKCLLLNAGPPDIALPPVQVRMVPSHIVLGAKSYYVYGDKLALVSAKEHARDFNFVIIDSLGFAECWREDFLALWDIASAAPFRDDASFQIPASFKSVNVKYLDIDHSRRRVFAK